jgi:hypothetical protein
MERERERERVNTWKSDEEEDMRVESDLRREVLLGEDLPFPDAVRFTING